MALTSSPHPHPQSQNIQGRASPPAFQEPSALAGKSFAGAPSGKRLRERRARRPHKPGSPLPVVETGLQPLLHGGGEIT